MLATSMSLSAPNRRCAIVYQHRVHARESVMPLMLEIIEKYNLDVKINRLDLTYRFENGSQLLLAGADREDRHRQFKGTRNDLIIIDEAQDWYTDIKRLCQWVRPSLADRRGRMFIQGTPGDVASGYFFEICNGQHPEWTLVKTGAFENPHTAEQIEEDLQILELTNPNARQLPWVRRQYFGEWCVDDRQNVIKVDAATNYIYSWHPEADDKYVIGVDWGDDRAAFVVGTYNPRRYPWLIYLEAQLMQEMLVQDYATCIRGLMERYPRAVVVADPGGMAKAMKREMETVYKIPMIRAEKEDRLANVEMLGSDISLGLIKLFNRNDPKHPEDHELARQWRQLVWMQRHRSGMREESHPRDLHDAALYVRRYAHPYLHREEDLGPKVGTPEWDRQNEAEIMARKARSILDKRRRGRGGSNGRILVH